MITRRGFLRGMAGVLAAGAAPAFIRHAMPVRVLDEFRIVMPDGYAGVEAWLATPYEPPEYVIVSREVNDLFTQIVAETFRRNQRRFAESVTRNNALLARLQ